MVHRQVMLAVRNFGKSSDEHIATPLTPVPSRWMIRLGRPIRRGKRVPLSTAPPKILCFGILVKGSIKLEVGNASKSDFRTACGESPPALYAKYTSPQIGGAARSVTN